ncbi:hypothetical protein LTR37_002826 [Vermiconidia calcicola]|uniref:Uncharacterized protein n=1 Tax=Vermiconidia calcicola TaxID=1690605 RepID=A0ACC3NTK5_9PEZI|nr:hypothetical protein LTR37_002826 [Vermiconidia calcicola]
MPIRDAPRGRSRSPVRPLTCRKAYLASLFFSHFLPQSGICTNGLRAMSHLPPGWWVKNSSGSYTGPPALGDSTEDINIGLDSDSDDDNNNKDDIFDIRPDSPGWEDLEADTENISYQCLLCPDLFPSARLMLVHCNEAHDFNFVARVKDKTLDFYSTIKYVNFIRQNVLNKGMTPEDATRIPTEGGFDGDEWMKPVLEGDSLLFTLDEIVEFEDDAGEGKNDVDGMEGVDGGAGAGQGAS